MCKINMNIITVLSLCCLQASVAIAGTPLGSVAGTAPAGGETFSSLKTADGIRQSNTLAYEPYVHGTVSENQPLVQVKINNSISATFLLDTGTNNSVITTELADRLKLQQQPILIKGKPLLFDGEPLNGVIPDNFSFGSFKFVKHLLVVLPQRKMGLPGRAIDGILGFDFLTNFACLFDFSQHEITVYSPVRSVVQADGSSQKYVAGGLTPDEITAVGFAGAKISPLTKPYQDGRVYVKVQCRNAAKSGEEYLILDTGSARTVISPVLAAQLDLKPTLENIASTAFLDKKNYLSTASIDQFAVGGLVLNNQSVEYSSQRAYDKNVPLSLGMDILSNYRVLMDFPAKKMYLQPNTPNVNITIKPQTPGVAAEIGPKAGH